MSSGKYVVYLFILLVVLAEKPSPPVCTEIKMNNITEIRYVNSTRNVVGHTNCSIQIPEKTGLDIKCENGTQIFCQPMEFNFERLNSFGVYGGQYCYNGSVEDCARIGGCENILSGREGNIYYYKVFC